MSQTILFGEGAHRQIGAVLHKLGCRKFLLVCGGSFRRLPIADYFETLNIPYVAFTDFIPNPQYDEVCRGVEVYRANGCDAIVAVGGGSAMDVAKCIKLYAKMADDVCYLEQPYVDTGIPLIVLPTTAGTGSESTRFAVIYHHGEKQSVHHDSILPDYAILEPAVLYTLPVYQKKCTMMDALGQAIESYWSVAATAESRELAARAILGIMRYWRGYIFEGDASATMEILRASNLAGQAIHITTTTAPHAMSYKLTTTYGLPHGHSVALCLPRVWEYMLTCADKDLRAVLNEIAAYMGAPSSEAAIEQLDEMMREMGLDGPATECREQEIARLVSGVNLQRLGNHPVSLSTDVLRQLYERIVK